MGGNITSSGLWVNGGKGTPMTWYDAKGVLENIFSNLGISVEYRPENIQVKASSWADGSATATGQKARCFRTDPSSTGAKTRFT